MNGKRIEVKKGERCYEGKLYNGGSLDCMSEGTRVLVAQCVSPHGEILQCKIVMFSWNNKTGHPNNCSMFAENVAVDGKTVDFLGGKEIVLVFDGGDEREV